MSGGYDLDALLHRNDAHNVNGGATSQEEATTQAESIPVPCFTIAPDRSIIQQDTGALCGAQESRSSLDDFLTAEFAKLRYAILQEHRSALNSNSAENVIIAFPERRLDQMKPEKTKVVCEDAECDLAESNSESAMTEITSKETPRLLALPESEIYQPDFESARSRKVRMAVFMQYPGKEESVEARTFKRSGSLQSLNERKVTLAVIAESPAFDMMIAMVVFVNCLFLCAEAQVDGMSAGNEIFNYGSVTFTDKWKQFYEIVDYVFIFIYLLEMLFKICVLRVRYFWSVWNVLDGATVVGSILFVMVMRGFVNPAFVRLARLTKLFRLTHILRTLTFFDSFLILTRSLKSSFQAVFWSLAFIFVIVFVCAFLLNHFIIQYLRDPSHALKSKDVFLYYGTFYRSMVSFLECSLGDWGKVTWLLMNEVSEFWGLFMVVYKVTAGWAMLNVITAVFLRLTMKEAEALDNYEIEQTKKATQKYKERLSNLFDLIDTSGDGKLSYDEFKLVCESASLKAWMKLMHVSTHDVDGLWSAIHNGNGEVDKDEFLNGFGKLDGPATAVDALTIKALIREYIGSANGDTRFSSRAPE